MAQRKVKALSHPFLLGPNTFELTVWGDTLTPTVIAVLGLEWGRLSASLQSHTPSCSHDDGVRLQRLLERRD